jgi:hypothetical protein
MKKSILYLVLLLILSCEVVFDSSLKKYIENVEARTPLLLEIENETGIKIKNELAVSYGYRAVSSSKDIVLVNKEPGSIVIKGMDKIEFNGLMVEGISETVLKPGEKLTLKSDFDVSVLPHTTVFIPVKLESSTGRPFVFNIWASSKMQPIDFFSDGKLVENIDLGVNDSVPLTMINMSLETVAINDVEIPQGFSIDIPYPLNLKPMEEKSFTLQKSNDLEQSGIFIFKTDFELINEASFNTFSGSILDISINYNNRSFGNNDSILLLEKNCVITVTNNNQLPRELVFSGDITSFIWNPTNKILDKNESVEINITVINSNKFYIKDEITGRSCIIYLIL